MTNEKRMSAYEKRAASMEGRLSLSAARAAMKVSEVMHNVKHQARLTSREIASRLSVSEGRVSQILNGDGNVRIATLARFLAACGYELTVTAKPIKQGPEIGTVVRRRDRSTRSQSWHVYRQTYVTSSGVSQSFDLVASVGEMPIPIGEPQHFGTYSGFTNGRPRAAISDEVQAWPEKTRAAVEADSLIRARSLQT